jgi:hypothetical protein
MRMYDMFTDAVNVRQENADASPLDIRRTLRENFPLPLSQLTARAENHQEINEVRPRHPDA